MAINLALTQETVLSEAPDTPLRGGQCPDFQWVSILLCLFCLRWRLSHSEKPTFKRQVVVSGRGCSENKTLLVKGKIMSRFNLQRQPPQDSLWIRQNPGPSPSAHAASLTRAQVLHRALPCPVSLAETLPPPRLHYHVKNWW